MAIKGTDDRLAEFQAERDRLFGLAYRMTGSAAEADDVVQDAWLRFESVHDAENPPALLTTIATRLCLDRLASASARKNAYVGPWLPEPVLTDGDPADLVELDEGITLGLLTVLERLSPVERAVFVLHEAFGFSFDEIASVVEKTAVNCRQIGRRARERVQAERPRFDVDREQQHRLTRAFVDAAMNGSVDRLAELLHEDVVLTSDGGAERRAARRPIVGARRVSVFIANLAQRRSPGTKLVYVDVNGLSGMVLTVDDVPVVVQELTWEKGRLVRVHAVLNPDKLGAVAADLEARPRPSTHVTQFPPPTP